LDRQKLSAIAHRRHPIACPFSDHTVDTLLDQLAPADAAFALDIGCGQGEWLRRLLTRHPELRGVGIDRSSFSLEAARSQTSTLSSRLELEQADASHYVRACSRRFDLVLCAGSTHALGGYRETLLASRRLLAGPGRLLIAEAYWQRPPTEPALIALGAKASDFSDLETTVETAVDAGYTPLHVATSTQDEWDEYESSWCGSLERYASDNPSDADRDELIETARAHRDGYLNGYRGVLGFAALVLRQA
jgi:ubiquinone/menaquinone biosynthesis C-methylase UbiE